MDDSLADGVSAPTALLAFDTASPTVSVALWDGEQVRAEARSEQPMRHGEQLAPLIAQVLGEAGVERWQITAVAVGVGPGPYTGLRVGLATATTMGLLLEVPVYGVCSLDALAAEAVAGGAVAGDFAVATDARRKEVFLARYDGEGRRVEGPVVDRPAALAAALGGLPVVGEGADLYPDDLGARVGPSRPSAGWLARAIAGELVTPLDPEPLYLRRPDAEVPGPPKPAS